MTEITPVTSVHVEQTQPHLTIQPSIVAADGSAWAFDGASGYKQIVAPWATEEHIRPIQSLEKLGDVESFCLYIARYGSPDDTLLTWNDRGLVGTLDYHTPDGTPGRCAWRVEHPFERTRQWQAWQRIASGHAMSQKALIEALEDHRDDIQAPDGATLVSLLRTLRANVNVKASSELEGNGNTRLSYERQTTTSVELPPSLTLGIPVLKGHTEADEQGRLGPVRYAIEVRIRVDGPDDAGKLSFRLTMPQAEQALENAVADRVAAAVAELPDGFLLLRAA
jgi:uncharacterized protein YfdQ (DUF2303 family)